MGVRMTVACAERTPEDLQGLVDELTSELNQLQGADVRVEQVAAPKGSRGDAISLGNILITFISSGAAVAAINVLKTYFQREPALKLKFKGADGEEVELDAKRLNDENTRRALGILEKSIAKKR
ncbi:MAG: hypothetical protein HZA52_12345 [Planctomycetes bacterium]|nr:hypothetical protein [Planctomycetota bacterium]